MRVRLAQVLGRLSAYDANVLLTIIACLLGAVVVVRLVTLG
jgi:hypothetical protein